MNLFYKRRLSKPANQPALVYKQCITMLYKFNVFLQPIIASAVFLLVWCRHGPVDRAEDSTEQLGRYYQ
jgi:hypothetical protein